MATVALMLVTQPRPMAAQGAGEISGDLPSNGGLAIVFWGGGPIEAVGSAAQARGCDTISTWTTHGGLFLGYIFGAPGFVNARFLNAIPGGELAPSTGLILVCRSASVGTPSDLVAPNLSQYLPSNADLDAYRAAVGLRDAGQHQQAATAFGQIGAAGGPMAPMAKLRAGQMLLLASQNDSAATALAQAVADPGLPPVLRVIGRIDAATALSRLNREAEALPMLEGVTAANGANASQVAYALWGRAQILRNQGSGGWVDLARTVVANHPTTPYALSALEALGQASVAVPPLEVALVYYRHQQNNTARTAYQQVASTGAAADAAVAWFYIGALEERANNNPAAIQAYQQSISIDPAGRLAADAHWWAAILLAASGNRSAAADHYATLSSSFPNSTFAADAGVRAALLRVQLGNTQQALSGLSTMLNNSSGATAARAARWIRVLGGDASSPANFQPRSIWAILDAAGAQADQPLPAAALSEGVTGRTADWNAAATWMNQRYGGAPGAPLSQDQALLRIAFGLNAAGEEAVARTVLFAYMRTLDGRPYALLELSRLASAAGMYDVSISAAERLLGPLLSSERMQTPFAIESLAYPAHFSQEMLQAAQAESIPPLLLMALVRRESMFRADAVSSAGARGLTQVMPATGQDIAASLGVPWNQSMLLDPATSLRFGAHYLKKRLDGFDGDVFGALAAYNGGAGNAARWYNEQAQPGADWYIETVNFGETRSYLRVVIEDYAWYRFVYGHASAPLMR